MVDFIYVGEYFKVSHSMTDGRKSERTSRAFRKRSWSSATLHLRSAQVVAIRRIRRRWHSALRNVHIAEVRPVPKLNYVQSRIDILPP